ncbi:hypothetical protein [Streptomyces sp. MK7]|uniref:hypothetical protein n=1 Tax=Streptomyces sp. MK7 TaxID=3067635 RepID=UPI00292E4B09|nr:hypothetical protein [Streptomyces sp. MK7]
MPESVPVRCPVCRRELVRGGHDQWPRPELACPCGTALRIPPGGSDTEETRDRAGKGSAVRSGDGIPGRGDRGRRGGEGTQHGDNGMRAPGTAHPFGPGSRDAAGRRPRTGGRGVFRPVVIRTARDAVTDAVLYLRWLGYEDIRRADQRPPSGIGLAARGLVAQVDPAARRASLRDVECLWLTAMTESAGCVYFSLTGYSGQARTRADELGIALFVPAPDGVPRPVNGPAHALGGAPGA